MAKKTPWPTTSDLYVALGWKSDTVSRLANGQETLDHSDVQRVIEALRGERIPRHLRDAVQEVVAAYDASAPWTYRGATPPSSSLLIDRITLAVDVKGKGNRADFADATREGMFPSRHPAYYIARRAEAKRGLGHLLRVSHSPQYRGKATWASISFAPSLLFDNYRDDLLDPKRARVVRAKLHELLDLVVARSITVTHLDVAADCQVPIWSYQALGTTSRRFRSYPPRFRVRTLQSGSRRSPISFSVYDKAHQLFRVHAIHLDHELTRVEARLRPKIRLARLSSLANPFEHVSAHLLEPERDDRAGLKLAIRLARIVGLLRLRPLLLAEQVASLLATTRIDPSTAAHPLTTFHSEWSRVAARLLTNLGRLSHVR